MSANLGIRLTLMAGAKVPRPLPADFVDLVECVEVAQSCGGRGGFQIVLSAARSGKGATDYAVIAKNTFKPFNRVLITVTFGPVPTVLMDGFVTRQELKPGTGDVDGRFVITGEDVSVMMDLQARIAEHPGQSEQMIANKILLKYVKYGVVPKVLPPPVLDVPLPTQRIPVQHGTDLQYLERMASRFGYVFYVTPGPAPLANVAYWGPPQWIGLPQRALTLTSGLDANVDTVCFEYDGLAPATRWGRVQDGRSNRVAAVSVKSSTLPPLSRRRALSSNRPNVRRELLEHTEGRTLTQARAQAQGRVNLSTTRVVSATGELDSVAYGGVLRPHALVGLRGAGLSYDGSYFVREVHHVIKPGHYRQKFKLQRAGVGTLQPLVRP